MLYFFFKKFDVIFIFTWLYLIDLFFFCLTLLILIFLKDI
jgi:hypothetical protein